MARRLRQCPGGIVYHVLNRAVAKIQLFKSVKDHEAFDAILQQSVARLPMELFAYCVMNNHWHLVVRPKKDGDLSKFIQWMTLTHVQRWRAAHNTVGYGPLYQGRFKAFPIQEDAHLLTVLRYVERNPVRAQIVQNAQDYRWGSLFARQAGSLEQQKLLADWPIDVPRDWMAFVNSTQTAAEEEELRETIKRSRPYGSSAWQARTAKDLGLLSTLSKLGRPAKKDP